MAIGINYDYGMEDIAVKLEDGQTTTVRCDILEMAAELCVAYDKYFNMEPPKDQLQETDLINVVFMRHGLPVLNSAAADKLAIEIIKRGTDLKKGHRAILESSSDAESPASSAV